MKIEGNAVLAFIIGDSRADRVVPRIGMTAWLTVFVSAAMAFLAVFALALALTTERVARAWADDLQRAATVRVSAPFGQVDTKTAAAVQILQTTPGIQSARVLSDAEQRALLEPWLGEAVALDSLPVPRLIEITIDRDIFDAKGLTQRLDEQLPGAVLDDHARWRAPLVAAAQRVRILGFGALALIVGVMAAMITLAARAALSANGQVSEVLRLIGARDVLVARAFVRRITLRAMAGALLGSGVGAIIVALFPPADAGTGLLVDFGFRGLQWLSPFLVVPGAGLVAFVATRAAALATLKRTA